MNGKNLDKIKKQKFSIKWLAIILIVVIIISTLSIHGWAKYLTKADGSSSGEIAKFIFNVSTNTEENMVINLAQTRMGIVQEAEVHPDYIGPGTSGGFQIQINATNSEVSILYNVQIDVENNNNTKFPKNLIFYADEGMKNALYHENNIINLNGFIAANDNEKVRTIDIYWKWDFETGQTENDKRENDSADSEWIGKNVTLPITVLGQQVNVNPLENQYTVTLDANGGVFLENYGNAEKLVKIVNLGDTYGELPVPTKDGYRFVGWNGKNLFDIENCVITKGRKENLSIILDAASVEGNVGRWMELQFYKNDKYVRGGMNNLSYNYYTFEKTDSFDSLLVKINTAKSDAYFIYYVDDILENGVTYTLSCDIDRTNIENAIATVSNIQLEEGTVRTEYEPYNVNSSVIYKNNSSNSLTAMWEPIGAYN